MVGHTVVPAQEAEAVRFLSLQNEFEDDQSCTDNPGPWEASPGYIASFRPARLNTIVIGVWVIL